MKNFVFLFLIIVSSFEISSAQELSILKERFASKKYVYYFNESDSILYRYENNKNIGYNAPNKIKAEFEISEKGVGFISNKYKSKDSTYVSLSHFDDKFKIEYYLIQNGIKSLLLDDEIMKADTVQEYSKFLLSDNKSIPYLYIMDSYSGEIIFQNYKNRISWLVSDNNYFFDITEENQEYVNNLLNNFVYDVYYKQKNKIIESPYKVNLRFLDFRIEKNQFLELLNNIQMGQNISLLEKEKPLIKTDNSDFSNYMKGSFFVSNNKKPMSLDSPTNNLIGNKMIDNIFEINDSSIYYIYSYTHYRARKTEEIVDTLKVKVKNYTANSYVLDYPDSPGSFDNIFKEIKSDTITEFNHAIKNKMIEIDYLKIINLLNDQIVFEISIKDNKVYINKTNVDIKTNKTSLFKKRIKDLACFQVPYQRTNAPYKVMLKWGEYGFTRHQTEKNVDSFIKKTQKCIEKTSR